MFSRTEKHVQEEFDILKKGKKRKKNTGAVSWGLRYDRVFFTIVGLKNRAEVGKITQEKKKKKNPQIFSEIIKP